MGPGSEKCGIVAGRERVTLQPELLLTEDLPLLSRVKIFRKYKGLEVIW